MRTQGEIPMRTKGEIEAAISEGVSRFEQEYMGRGPKDIQTHLLGDLLCRAPPRRLDRCRAALSQVTSLRKGEGLAQASSDSSD